MKDAIVEIFEGQQITIRPSDGYWNATEMCKRYDKRINNFLRNGKTQDYIAALSEVTRIRAMYQGDTLRAPDTGFLVISKQQGTWVHPQVALKLAAWLNPYFEVWVFEVIERLLAQGRVELQEAYDSLKAALETSEEQAQELLAKSERLQIDLSRLGDEYERDDAARELTDEAWRVVEMRDRENERLREKIRELGGDPDAD